MLESALPAMIVLHPAAPAKPPEGDGCNGCGLCCAVAPCPLGIWLSKRRHGRCAALKWDDRLGRYGCEAATAPKRWFPALPESLARGLALRWIAAGRGCDSDLLAQPASGDDAVLHDATTLHDQLQADLGFGQHRQ